MQIMAASSCFRPHLRGKELYVGPTRNFLSSTFCSVTKGWKVDPSTHFLSLLLSFLKTKHSVSVVLLVTIEALFRYKKCASEDKIH
jgi:hypothetical protein